jgi:hypothetical protein
MPGGMIGGIGGGGGVFGLVKRDLTTGFGGF